LSSRVNYSEGVLLAESGKRISTASGATGVDLLVDETTGVAAATIEELADGSTYATDFDAIINNFASLAAAHNALVARLQALGLVSYAVVEE
jgi:hypothetical protein